MEQISFFDILGDKPVRYLVTFKDFYGYTRQIVIELNDKNEMREALKKCREEHKDLYFQYYEEI